MINKNLTRYILEAYDIEILEKNKLLIITKRKKILLNEVSEEFLEKCYEIFSEKYRKTRKQKTNYSKIFWSDDEIKYLKENYLKEEINKIALKINKSNYQINLMLVKLKLIVKREWSESEIKFLQNNIEDSTVKLAEKLNRSIASIKAKKRILKLLKI
ncbi:MAG: hypothetical protein RR523_04765 [Cetobacterium sp.]|uniref:hypothetical protein n=1 Tax=Cetobacterium sp. TaxID=2071632 RepID=UPI002FC583A6